MPKWTWSPQDIKADQNYEIIDQRSTLKNREDALKTVLPVYDYDEQVAAEVDRRILESFEKSRIFLAQHPQVSQGEMQAYFERISGITLSEEETKSLFLNKFKPELEDTIRNVAHPLMGEAIVEDANALRKNSEQGVVIRRVRAPSPENETTERNLKGIHSIDEIRNNLEESVKKDWNPALIKGMTPEELASIAGRFLRINLTSNVPETSLRQTNAFAAVKPVIIKIQAGESIIRSGDRYQPWHLVVLQGIQRQKQQSNALVKFGGTFGFVALLVLVTYFFAARSIRKFNPTRLDLVFLGTNLITILIFVRLFAAMASAFSESLSFDRVQVEMQTIYYAIPVAAGTMLVRLILNSEVAIVFAVIASALTGLFLRTDLDLSIYFLVSSIARAGSIADADRRSAILKAGLLTGLINALTIFTIKMVQVVSVTERWATADIIVNMISGFMGGTNSALYVLFYTPIVEMIFGYTTDIKLLELGNLNHPLLKEMIVKAPGTYHHSQLVAVLAEAATESIGANPILARVGAYFHDIGKMKKPLYFIENQMGGENRHILNPLDERPHHFLPCERRD
jgi:putative nucleotidyltransferase with HDIG domain